MSYVDGGSSTHIIAHVPCVQSGQLQVWVVPIHRVTVLGYCLEKMLTDRRYLLKMGVC